MEDKQRMPRRVVARRWTTLGAGVATAAVLTAPAAAGGPADAAVQKAAQPLGAMHVAQNATNEGGEGGEGTAATEGGEGGEGGERGAVAGNPEADYLAALGLIEGHLRAALALTEAEQQEMARTHAKHPGDEIYGDLRPGLDAHGAAPFDAELETLADALGSGAPLAEVRAAHAVVVERIAEAREHAAGGASARLDAAVQLARIAAEEYQIGVQDGEIANLHEYQDAWGFLQIARDELGQVADGGDQAAAYAAEQMLTQLGTTDPLFPAIVPEGRIEADPSLLWGAAARMEIAALKVD